MHLELVANVPRALEKQLPLLSQRALQVAVAVSLGVGAGVVIGAGHGAQLTRDHPA